MTNTAELRELADDSRYDIQPLIRARLREAADAIDTFHGEVRRYKEENGIVHRRIGELDVPVLRGGRILGTINYLAEKNDALRKENAELRAVVERLPLSADGVRVCGGDIVWILPGDKSGWAHNENYYEENAPPMGVRMGGFYGDHFWFDNDGDAPEGDHWFSKFYSTCAAAESAIAAKEAHAE